MVNNNKSLCGISPIFPYDQFQNDIRNDKPFSLTLFPKNGWKVIYYCQTLHLEKFSRNVLKGLKKTLM